MFRKNFILGLFGLGTIKLAAQTKVLSGVATTGRSLYQYTEHDGNPGLGVVNGVNTTFITSVASLGKVMTYLNGLHQRQGFDYNLASDNRTVTFVSTNIPQVGDTVDIDYLAYL